MKKFKNGGIGEEFYFCLTHNNNALCGSGESVKNDLKIISSQDALKLLDSILFDKKLKLVFLFNMKLKL